MQGGREKSETQAKTPTKGRRGLSWSIGKKRELMRAFLRTGREKNRSGILSDKGRNSRCPKYPGYYLLVPRGGNGSSNRGYAWVTGWKAIVEGESPRTKKGESGSENRKKGKGVALKRVRDSEGRPTKRA